MIKINYTLKCCECGKTKDFFYMEDETPEDMYRIKPVMNHDKNEGDWMHCMDGIYCPECFKKLAKDGK